jgi:hypothetical protein
VRLVQGAFGVEAEERVHVLGGHALAHLGPGLLIGLTLEREVTVEDLAEDAHPVDRAQWLGTGQRVVPAVMASRREGDGRYRCDVMGIDHRDRHLGPRRADDVPGLKLRHPLQRVGHEAERPQERPRQARGPDGRLGVHHVAGDGVAWVAAFDGAAGNQHHLLDTRPPGLVQRAGHVLVSRQQEQPAHPGQGRPHAVR